MYPQRDNTLARMLFSLLYQSVFQQVDEVLTESEAEATKKAIKEGLNVIMESSTQFHPPFIGSLQVRMCVCVWTPLVGWSIKQTMLSL